MENEKSLEKIALLKNRNNILTIEISELQSKQITERTDKRIKGNFEEIEVDKAIILGLENLII